MNINGKRYAIVLNWNDDATKGKEEDRVFLSATWGMVRGYVSDRYPAAVEQYDCDSEVSYWYLDEDSNTQLCWLRNAVIEA